MNTQVLRDIRDILAKLYGDEFSAKRVATDSGLDLSRIDFSTQSINNWHAILSEADKAHQIDAVLEIAINEYPNNLSLRNVYNDYHQSIDKENIESGPPNLPESSSKRLVSMRILSNAKLLLSALGILGLAAILYLQLSPIRSIVPTNMETTLPPAKFPCTDGDFEVECNALVAFYKSTNGQSWKNNDGWLIISAHCEWHGITCNSEGYVTHLRLVDNRLSGEISPQLRDLKYLQFLQFQDNGELGGTIPAELGEVVSLTTLLLSGNHLTGTIPPQLENLENLQNLQLHNNRELNGPIPIQLGNLTQLTDLLLSGNKLTGTIPAQLGRLTKLGRLHLQSNALSGPIPVELGNLEALLTLLLDRNQLEGPVPPELCNIKDLTRLTLNNNNLLSGPLPVCLGTSPLRELYFYNTDICIPNELQEEFEQISDLRGTNSICE